MALEIIPWYQSTTLRALVISIVTMLMALSGTSETVINSTHAAQIADSILLLLSLGGQVWAMYSRATKVNPPITQLAQDKTVAMIEEQSK